MYTCRVHQTPTTLSNAFIGSFHLCNRNLLTCVHPFKSIYIFLPPSESTLTSRHLSQTTRNLPECLSPTGGGVSHHADIVSHISEVFRQRDSYHNNQELSSGKLKHWNCARHTIAVILYLLPFTVESVFLRITCVDGGLSGSDRHVGGVGHQRCSLHDAFRLSVHLHGQLMIRQ